MSVLDDSPMRDLADRAIRQSLLHPEHLQTFLQQAVPDLAAGFDCSRARLLDREFPLDDWRRREADLPFEVPYRTGAEEEIWALVCVLLEHQSDTDPLMPLRLLYFAALYWDRQWHEWEQQPTPRPPLRLRPVLPIVLYTGPRPWGSNRTLADLLGEPATFHPFAPAWQPLFWNLADQTPQQLLTAGQEWLQMLAVVRVQDDIAEEFAAVFTEAVRQLGKLHGVNKVRWYDLMRIVLAYAAWKRPSEERGRLFGEVKATQENLIRQEEIMNRGEQTGSTLAEDFVKLEEEVRSTLTDIAMAMGRLLACRETLRMLLEDRFQQLPAELVQRIETCKDLGRLQAAIRQVHRVEKIEDLQL